MKTIAFSIALCALVCYSTIELAPENSKPTLARVTSAQR